MALPTNQASAVLDSITGTIGAFQIKPLEKQATDYTPVYVIAGILIFSLVLFGAIALLSKK